MALNSLEMNTLVHLHEEYREVIRVNGHVQERWDINNNETAIILKFLENRIKELEDKKIAHD
jgi:hypothetical protein